MKANPASQALITVLRSTSFLLKHYRYDDCDPSLSELLHTLGLAVARLEAKQERSTDQPNTVGWQEVPPKTYGPPMPLDR
jgi:hypothetical protein